MCDMYSLVESNINRVEVNDKQIKGTKYEIL